MYVRFKVFFWFAWGAHALSVHDQFPDSVVVHDERDLGPEELFFERGGDGGFFGFPLIADAFSGEEGEGVGGFGATSFWGGSGVVSVVRRGGRGGRRERTFVDFFGHVRAGVRLCMREEEVQSERG
jgi:hypothetical protein